MGNASMAVYGILRPARRTRGGPLELKSRRGKYTWAGNRLARLCACFEHGWGLSACDLLDFGARREIRPQFLDFDAMWPTGYSRIAEASIFESGAP